MRLNHVWSISLLTFALTACGSLDTLAPVMPTVQSIAGSYGAAHVAGSNSNLGILTITTAAGVTTDELAKGASIQITLNSDGTTAGHITIPDDKLDEDLAGTWVLKGHQVSLNQSADTFLRDITFIASGGQLDGTSTFNGTTVYVTLRRP